MAGIPQPAAINYAHNDYLQLLAECGFVGFGLMAWALVATLRHLFSRFANHADWEVAAIGSSLTAGIVAFLLHSLVDFNMHIPANALMFCLLVSVALVLAQRAESDSGRWIECPSLHKEGVRGRFRCILQPPVVPPCSRGDAHCR